MDEEESEMTPGVLVSLPRGFVEYQLVEMGMTEEIFWAMYEVQ